MTFDPKKPAANNYLAGLLAAKKAVSGEGKAAISKLVDAHTKATQAAYKAKKSAVKPPKKSGK